MASQRSKIHVTYTASGLRRYETKVWHTELNKIQVIRGDAESTVEQKAKAKMRQWDEMWEKKEKLSLAGDQTSEALLDREELEKILKHTLDIDDTIDWESLKNKDKFPEPKPQNPSPKEPKEPKIPPPPEKELTIPKKPKEPTIPAAPDSKDRKYQPTYSFLDLFSKKKA